MKTEKYLETSILSTAVDRLQTRRIDESKYVTHIVMGVNRVETLKRPSRPDLEGVNAMVSEGERVILRYEHTLTTESPPLEKRRPRSSDR